MREAPCSRFGARGSTPPFGGVGPSRNGPERRATRAGRTRAPHRVPMSHAAARRFAYAFLLATAVLSVVSWRRADPPTVAVHERRCPDTG